MILHILHHILQKVIVFVRHAKTTLDSHRPSSQWPLAKEAYYESQQLALSLREFDLWRIITSTELKAKETGRLMASVLKIPCEEAKHLHEHERKDVAFMDNETFRQIIQDFFAYPDKLVFGQETANQALRRFDQAVKNVLLSYSNSIAIVTHGTVLSLFIAHYNALNAYQFWQGLKMPDKIVTGTDFKLR